eukprot:TRINITY_DN56819_c0_g1_i1.p1 TRINITY_DN56819_c0_g1~~TRINITY_DN56819_c0_g1_i1.p1  ORF type:complete len:301 (+),score=45.92 TRINITY_DN56819_c0_g1_i1:97-903(+)
MFAYCCCNQQTANDQAIKMGSFRLGDKEELVCETALSGTLPVFSHPEDLVSNAANDSSPDPSDGNAKVEVAEASPRATVDSPAASEVDAEETNSEDDTYVVEVYRDNGVPLGLDCTVTHHEIPLVMTVGPGPLMDWNNMRTGDEQIKDGDRVIEVNGITTNPASMLSAMVEHYDLRIAFRRRTEFSLTLEKGQVSIGLDINCKKSREGLLINRIKPGIVMNWNLANPQKQIREKDRIVEVNGFRGDPRMLLERMKLAEILRMTIVLFN